MTQCNKILVVGPAWVGDMVMAQGMFQFIKKRDPETLIDVLAPPWTGPLLARMLEVRRTIPVPFVHGQFAPIARWKLGRSLRMEEYTQAIVLPRSLKSAIVPAAAHVRQRTGFLGELRWGWLNDVRQLDKTVLPRTFDRFIALALNSGETLPRSLPQPVLKIDIENTKSALHRLKIKTSDRPVLGLCPGAEYGPAKRWPIEHFAQLACRQLDRGWDVWIFGSDKDSDIAKTILNQTAGRCLDLTGKTNLIEVVDLMALSRIVVSNDSGLMHIAAALDIDVIAIFGSSNPGHTPPLSDKAQILHQPLSCSPCMERECRYGHYKCLTGIKADTVIRMIDKLAGNESRS